jgi:hypothetical protein
MVFAKRERGAKLPELSFPKKRTKMEFLKEHLGEELYKEVSEKLKGKGVKVVDASGGGYVSKEKYLREIGEKEKEIKGKETELNQLRSNVVADEGVKKQLETLTQELELARNEVGRFKNEKTILGNGIKSKYIAAAICEATKLLSKEVSFEKAAEEVAKNFPEWKQEGKPMSSFSLNGSGHNIGDEDAAKEAANAVIRRAIK